MTVPTLLRDRLHSPLRGRTGVALAALLLGLLAVAGWFGARAWRFRRDEGAAREALARYDFPEARRRLASCLVVRPGDPAALLLAVQAARRDGQLGEAQDYLDRYRERARERSPEAALQATLLQVQRGLVKEHVRGLLEYLEIRHPDSEQILEALAQGCVRVYRLDEAMFWTRQLLDRFPDNPVGQLVDAQTNETLRRPDRAREIARRLVERYPGDDKARLYLAALLLKDHQYDEAAGHYRELHRRRAGDVEPLLGLVRCLLPLEHFDEAAPLLRELEQHAENSEAQLECGRFALSQRRPADAEPFLRRAEALAPNDADVQRDLAVCLGQLNRTSEARQHLARSQEIEADLVALEKAFTAMAKAPGDPAPRREAGRICLRNGQVTEGLRWLDGALELAPGDKETHAILADYYAAQGDEARAKYHRGKAQLEGR